ncbi:ferredoxin oxidoreductase [Candidatus Berkelbacteria bacterium RBG_13_40_8]|uniref:Ferredoxin oxidoreductase n=1 Tax=Candidatus Berkelbacteria bacterium RBG_13_40_8 TaxID=1797467 RepID=A0A1F5DQ70_9BACT|nr:MAG: ferredoxin oxidoreductase [Candidatus Berkelbacteria bacterium RBG_13_40_8]
MKMTKEFLTGNQAAIKGALASGAQMMTGYPITPTTEMMEEWALEATKNPQLKFLQTEDEMSAGFAMIGGVLAGLKAFTTTAGPGNVLMQDAFSMAEALRLPTVALINQRGGPSTGTVIYSQQEVNLTCFGGNGEGLRIVYSAGSVQEMYDFSLKAFNVAWKYRFPTFVLADGYLAKTLTEIETYDPQEKQLEIISPSAYLLNEQKGANEYINLRNTYNLEEELNGVTEQHHEDFKMIIPEIVEYDDYHTLDAEIVILAHGIVATSAKVAVDALRAEGKKVGMFRPISLRPFPRQSALAVMQNKKSILIIESSLWQFERLVKENLYGINIPVATLQRPAMGINSEEIINKVNEILNPVKSK